MRSRQSGAIGGLLAVVSLLTLGLVACGDEESTGASGPPGPAGATGTAGPAGSPGAAATPTPPNPDPPAPTAPKAVYTTSNDATANAIVVYSRAADGTLTPKRSYLTGGRGAGMGLGNQGALAFDETQNLFYAVNAGDDSISMLALGTDGELTLQSKISSGGVRPISIAVSGKVLYVLNAGNAATAAAANISGFKIAGGGFAAIAGSTQPLSAANPGPAQISFMPESKILVVTEKGTNMIDTYTLNASDVASAPKSQASAGQTPFGFAFAGKQLLVSEAFGGMAGKGAASSYTIAADGTITPKTSSIMSMQAAPCWVAVSKANTHAFVTNTASNTVTTYKVAADGVLTLANANGVAGETGGKPSDVDVTDDSGLLYTLNGGDHTISIFAVSGEGALTKRPDLAGVPEFASGLVAR